MRTGGKALLARLDQADARFVVPILKIRALGFGALLAVAFLTLPIASYPLTPMGEYQYQSAMTVAFREHLQWGSQIVWTYGPYGYMNVLDFMDFRTWALALAANLAAHAALFAVLALFLLRTKASTWGWLFSAALVIVLFDRYRGFDFERFPVLDHKLALTATLLLFLAIESTRRRTAVLLAGAAGVVGGYLVLDKGTFLITFGTLMVVYAVLSVFHGRTASVAALLAGLVAGCLGLWISAGQAIGGLPGYFSSLYEIIAGYTPAMSWFNEAPAAHPALQEGIGFAMLLATALSLLLTLWRRDWPFFSLLLLGSPLLFFTFKNAFIRFDEIHALTFWSLAALLQGLVLVRLMGANGGLKGRRVPALVGGVTVLAGAVLVGGLGPAIGMSPDLKPGLAFPDNLVSYRHAAALLVTPDRRRAEEEQVLAVLRSVYPLPPEVVDELRNGTVDVVPWDIQLAFAYGFRWDPQPVLLSYQANTPYLDHINAQHYREPDAPRFVVFVSQDIDGRYPLFSEPETYRVLLERYELRHQLGNLLVLEQRPNAGSFHEQSVGNVSARIGDWIQVPTHGDQPIYGRVRVDYSLLGRALNLLDRPPELHIRFRYSGGQMSPFFRFIPGVGSDGLQLSSYAPTTTDVANLAQGQFNQPIEAIRIDADPPAQAYQSNVSVAFFTTAAW